MKFITPLVFAIVIISACKKEQKKPAATDYFVTYGNKVFDKRTSANLKTHPLLIDTTAFAPYTLTGYGAFAGKSRVVDYSDGGTFENIPVLAFSGWDEFGFTFIAKDTSGTVHEFFRRKFNSTGIVTPYPFTVFISKGAEVNDQWTAFAGWDQGNNTLYQSLQAKILSKTATTSTGIAGCIAIEYKSPDYADTVYFKPGKGPVEVRSWRAYMESDNQPGTGGFR